EEDARLLVSQALANDSGARLAAAALLRRHSGDEAVRLLQGLAQDAEPAVAAAALVRLVEIDPKLVVPWLNRLLASSDAQLRSLAVAVLERQPSENHIRVLADRLNDPHPEVRIQARRALRQVAAEPRLTAVVGRHGTRLLTGGSWRGQEQAAILVAQIHYKEAAGRLVERLTASRGEVSLAAAWGLRQVAVADTLPAVLDFFESPRRDRPDSQSPAGKSDMPAEAVDRQLSQLAQFLGQSRYRPAEAALRRLIPRPTSPGLTGETRAAAIWALGLLHEAEADTELVRALEGRLRDVGNPMGPEDSRVQAMSAVALGRMKAKTALHTLRSFWSGKPTLDPVPTACGWAIAQITGEVVPPAGIVEIMARDWFLTPLPDEIRNPKHEIRNNSEMRSTKP
ncbi:MAG: HEAT repeat domain-containing protein, partial [Gemmataceae bacterium]|nr:HEAT repeat domain-containing protein [Gemmataceae bacterium]